MEKVHTFKTKHKEGFTQLELSILLTSYPGIDMEKFNNALMGNTCMGIDNQIIYYHHDIEKAIRCGMEKRNLTQEEWD